MKTINLVLSQAIIQKYRNQEVILRDANLPYLFFRYSKANKHVGSFQLSFTSNGKSTSRVIGRYPPLDIKAARVAATAKWQSIESSKYTATKITYFKNCGELLNWYREFRCADPNISMNTKRNIEHQIERVLRPTLVNQRSLDLSAGFLSEVWLKAGLENYQISTLSNCFQCLKAAYNKAYKLGYIKTNPIDKVSFSDLSSIKIQQRANRIQFWRIAKLTKLINELPPELRVLSLLCLGYLTRNQETVLARWQHFDFKNLIWHIPVENTKTGQGITHPITAQMAEMLKRYRKWQMHKTRSKFLFPQQSGYRPISASQAAKKIALHTDGKYRLHDLRKFGSNSLRDMGVDYYIVERILNHKMTALDQTYIQTSSRKIIANSLSDWHLVMKS